MSDDFGSGAAPEVLAVFATERFPIEGVFALSAEYAKVRISPGPWHAHFNDENYLWGILEHRFLHAGLSMDVTCEHLRRLDAIDVPSDREHCADGLRNHIVGGFRRQYYFTGISLDEIEAIIAAVPQHGLSAASAKAIVDCFQPKGIFSEAHIRKLFAKPSTRGKAIYYAVKRATFELKEFPTLFDIRAAGGEAARMLGFEHHVGTNSSLKTPDLTDWIADHVQGEQDDRWLYIGEVNKWRGANVFAFRDADEAFEFKMRWT